MTSSIQFVPATASSPGPITAENAAGTFAFLAKRIASEKHLLHPSSQELQQSFEDGLSLLLFDGEMPIAHTRLTPLADGWHELGSTWVHKGYRGRGLSNDLYAIFLETHKEKNILATTTNMIALQTGKHFKFVLIKRRQLPESVWKSSCTCSASKTGCINDNLSCRLAFGEPQKHVNDTCFFRVTAETAARNGLS